MSAVTRPRRLWITGEIVSPERLVNRIYHQGDTGTQLLSRHRFHGDPTRFDVVARFLADRFPAARYVADVAGGQGMLTRILRKKFGIEAEVIDPRGWTLKGVPGRAESYDAAMADYYDLVVGLHPDEALGAVVESADRRPVLVVPCCNFWSREEKLGRDELADQIAEFHTSRGGTVERVVMDFAGPKNRALVLVPATSGGRAWRTQPLTGHRTVQETVT